MEPIPQHPHPTGPVSPPQLPSGKNKIERIGDHTKGLVDEFTTWVELRLKLLQVEIQEKVQSKVNETVIKVAPLVAGAITGFFVLVTAALFVGWWLGHPAWGFLVVTGFLSFITIILASRSRKLKREQEEEKSVDASENGAPGGRQAARRGHQTRS